MVYFRLWCVRKGARDEENSVRGATRAVRLRPAGTLSTCVADAAFGLHRKLDWKIHAEI